MDQDRDHWAIFNPQRSGLVIRRVTGLAETDQHSYHRELRYDIPDHWKSDESYLTLEFSIPKFWYGHNVSLLYDWVTALEYLRTLLPKQIGLGRSSLPPVGEWLVNRVDFCYAWKLPDQQCADMLISALSRLNYPYKKPVIYSDSVMWPGTTYSVKVYNKLNEFKQHDLKAMLEQGKSLEWINSIEAKAEGVVRFEVTCRTRWLKRQGIKTISDLSGIDEERSCVSVDFEIKRFFDSVGIVQIDPELIQSLIEYGIKVEVVPTESSDLAYLLYDKPYRIPPCIFDYAGKSYDFPGGLLTFKTVSKPLGFLQFFLKKFVGDGSMSVHDTVQRKLDQKYKPSKASRLMGTWLQIQKYGSYHVKSRLGKSTYYQEVKDLKDAGVMLIESNENIVITSPDFFSHFKLDLPSPYAVNKVDDFRDGDNLLNLDTYKHQKAT
jgi:Phage replication protein CRI